MTADAKRVHRINVCGRGVTLDLNGGPLRDQIFVAVRARFGAHSTSHLPCGVTFHAGKTRSVRGSVPVMPEGIRGQVHILVALVAARVRIAREIHVVANHTGLFAAVPLDLPLVIKGDAITIKVRVDIEDVSAPSPANRRRASTQAGSPRIAQKRETDCRRQRQRPRSIWCGQRSWESPAKWSPPFETPAAFADQLRDRRAAPPKL